MNLCVEYIVKTFLLNIYNFGRAYSVVIRLLFHHRGCGLKSPVLFSAVFFYLSRNKSMSFMVSCGKISLFQRFNIKKTQYWIVENWFCGFIELKPRCFNLK